MEAVPLDRSFLFSCCSSQAAFSELSRQGRFPDPAATAIEDSFMPWLYAQADGHFEDSSTAFALVNELLQHAILTHEDMQRKAEEEATALAKSQEVVVEEEGFLKIFVQGIEGLEGPGGPIHVSAKDTIEEVEKKIQVGLLYVVFFFFVFPSLFFLNAALPLSLCRLSLLAV
jgi:hypothetical protein